MNSEDDKMPQEANDASNEIGPECQKASKDDLLLQSEHTINTQLSDLTVDALNGNAAAAEILIRVAKATCAAVGDVTCSQPTIIDPIAARLTSWPIDVDIHPDLQKRNLRWLKDLPLGRESFWKRPKGRKWYSLDVTANWTVELEIKSMVMESALDGLKRSSAPTFSEIWPRILAKYNRDPNARKVLRPLGISNARKTEDIYPQGTKTYETKVRDGIRERLKQAFNQMCRSQEIKPE